MGKTIRPPSPQCPSKMELQNNRHDGRWHPTIRSRLSSPSYELIYCGNIVDIVFIIHVLIGQGWRPITSSLVLCITTNRRSVASFHPTRRLSCIPPSCNSSSPLSVAAAILRANGSSKEFSWDYHNVPSWSFSTATLCISVHIHHNIRHRAKYLQVASAW
jgi:hypothetical protein